MGTLCRHNGYLSPPLLWALSALKIRRRNVESCLLGLISPGQLYEAGNVA